MRFCRNLVFQKPLRATVYLPEPGCFATSMQMETQLYPQITYKGIDTQEFVHSTTSAFSVDTLEAPAAILTAPSAFPALRVIYP
jgi:hypothetical protein